MCRPHAIGLDAALGYLVLTITPMSFGIPGCIAPIVLSTVGYALFQTANNAAVMTELPPGQRGVVAGMLNLSRNLGLITGASAMGAVFAFGAATRDIKTATPEAIATGMQVTFAVAAMLLFAALAIALGAFGRTGQG